MEFLADLHDRIVQHRSVNNSFLDRFGRGEVQGRELDLFCAEYYHFVRRFPKILMGLLANVPDEAMAGEITKILLSELGDGDPAQRHELLYRRFLRSAGLDPAKLIATAPLPTTEAWLSGLERLYSHRTVPIALGASFGTEHMANTMWDHLNPGIERLKRDRPAIDDEYFTFHKLIEDQHEDWMEKAIAALVVDEPGRRQVEQGAWEALDLEAEFWLGIERAAREKQAA